MDAFGKGKKFCPSRRDFIARVAPACMVAAALPVALAGCSKPAPVEVDITNVKPGQGVSAQWDGKPVFIRRRTEEEIETTRKDDAAAMPDPAKDSDRVKKPEWIVVIGICPHHGCTLFGTKSVEPRGHFGGWFCPCHAAEFDLSGRVRKGPAKTNLSIPPYAFVSETKIRIG
ncbi:hypothetical protein FACS1894205_0830 [Alphaproteobacteria bacterium]|nr:hypothetical protein FACS1894205_0830 [Alphaproteobacteria bacterium]